VSLKVKEQVSLKFKSEGNKIQFRFNEEIAADLAKLQKDCTSSVNNSLITDICDKLKSPCEADPKGRLRSRTAHIIRIWTRTSF
jgi:hypothetical protein